MFTIRQFLPVALAVGYVAAQKCNLQFDGRVPKDFAPTEFDDDNGIFDPEFVKGKGLKFSELLEMTERETLFDVGSVPITVTINDSSIFAPSDDNVQTGFRRAELLPASNDGADDSTLGIKTLHFSVAKDPSRPLNFSHEYQLAFLESADYSTNQFVLKTGTILGRQSNATGTLQLYGNVNDGELLFWTPFEDSVVHNFALTLDFESLTTQVFYSQDSSPLEPKTDAIPNDVSGQGQFHFGILKKPTGTFDDITKDGYQPSGIDEGILYGGIFQEDSSDGCISLEP